MIGLVSHLRSWAAWTHRKRLPAAVGLALCAVALAGCGNVVSLHAPYAASDVIVDETLVGTWVAAGHEGTPQTFQIDESTTWTFAARRDRAMDLTIARDEGPIEVRAGLFQFGPYLFMDLQPSAQITSAYAGLVIPVHLMFRIVRSRDAMLLKPLSADWMKERLRRGDPTPRHVLYKDDVILIGPTQEVRGFLLVHAADPQAFAPLLLLVRKE